ncbi:hypothetical protein [Nonomuraea rhizosphaerae]|uniref:hypothetical protein n=1 Tax=Nonomuraea rhizosphaerae TaxID=2665663 RepID=UPI001C5EF4F2|nr:hypothetical protein [Nonomuraea rhizosphaerae]
MREVYVPYMESSRGGYDAALTDARDRLARLADRVTARGRDYSADRVRLYAQRLGDDGPDAKPFPEGVPLPPETQPRSGNKDYKGNRALTITRLVPGGGPWHLYSTPSHQRIALWWRYLLPHE